MRLVISTAALAAKLLLSVAQLAAQETPLAPVIPDGLVVASADWCGPCRVTHRNAAGLGSVTFLDVDAPADKPKVAALWSARRTGWPRVLPSYCEVRGGKPVRFWAGFPASRGQLLAMGATAASAPSAAPPSASASPAGPAFDVASAVRIAAGDARGSGVVVRRDAACYFALTNAHVVRAGWPHQVLVGDVPYDARVVDHDVKLDLALVAFSAPGEIPVVPVSAEPPPNRARVTTHGFPRGGARRDRATSLTAGSYKDLYAVAGPFVNGESGGAVVEGGELVGLVTGNAGGVGLVVDLPSIKAFLADAEAARDP